MIRKKILVLMMILMFAMSASLAIGAIKESAKKTGYHIPLFGNYVEAPSGDYIHVANNLLINSGNRLIVAGDTLLNNDLEVRGEAEFDNVFVNGKLDVVGNSLMGMSTTANNDNTYFRLLGGHYDKSKNPVTAIMTAASNGNNVVRIGGGTSLGNAATRIDFYTADTDNAGVGTRQMRLDSKGDLYLEGSVFVNDVEVIDKNGNVEVDGGEELPECGDNQILKYSECSYIDSSLKCNECKTNKGETHPDCDSLCCSGHDACTLDSGTSCSGSKWVCAEETNEAIGETAGPIKFTNENDDPCTIEIEDGIVTQMFCEVILIGGQSGEDCDDAGGQVVTVDDGKICKFSRSSCPSGWTQHKEWQSYGSSEEYGATSMYYNKECEGSPPASNPYTISGTPWSDGAEPKSIEVANGICGCSTQNGNCNCACALGEYREVSTTKNSIGCK